MKQNTQVEAVYDSFLSKITDDLYGTMTLEEIKSDMSNMLNSAISRFYFPRKPITVEGESFTERLSSLEVEILSNFMVGEWINRQINTVRLMEVQFTGNDAKALNTGAQLKALLSAKEAQKRESKELMHYYHFGKMNDDGTRAPNFHLSGKKK